jgi:hypothetical protein
MSTFYSYELFPVFYADDNVFVLSSKYIPICQLRAGGLLWVIVRDGKEYAYHDSWAAKLAQSV